MTLILNDTTIHTCGFIREGSAWHLIYPASFDYEGKYISTPGELGPVQLGKLYEMVLRIRGLDYDIIQNAGVILVDQPIKHFEYNGVRMKEVTPSPMREDNQYVYVLFTGTLVEHFRLGDS